MKHEEGYFEGTGGLQLFRQSWFPEGDIRAALAVVHGFGEHSGRYGNLVGVAVPKGYVVHAFDLRGHGRSPGPRGYINSFADFREDVGRFLAWVQSQHPALPLFLLGHSMGGLIVLEYVLHDADGLAGVVASGPLLGQAGISPLLFWMSRLLSGVLPRLTLNTSLDATTISRDPAVVEAYVGDPLVHSLGTPRLSTELTKAYTWVQAHAGDLDLPCLIVQGGADQLVPPESVRQFYEHIRCADKTLHIYPGYYHEVFNDIGKEQPLSDVMAWLEEHIQSGATAS